MSELDIVRRQLLKGRNYPFDAPDGTMGPEHGLDPSYDPVPATDWAHAAARGVVADLCGQRQIKWGFENINEEVRVELISDLAAIIRVAQAER